MEYTMKYAFPNTAIATHFSNDLIKNRKPKFPIGESLDKSHMFRNYKFTVFPRDIYTARKNFESVVTKHRVPDVSANVTRLHLAAFNGKIDEVKRLIRTKTDSVDARTTVESFTPLHFAVANNHVNVIEALLAEGAMANIAGESGYSAVISACERGHLEALRLLLQKGKGINRRTNERATLLHMAAISGDVDVLNFILKQDVDGLQVDCKGVTPLAMAVDMSHLAVSQMLMACWVKLVGVPFTGYEKDKERSGQPKSIAGLTLMHLAAQNGLLTIVQLLIKLEAKVNVETENLVTPLHLCAQEGHFKIAQLLLRHGAYIDCEDFEKFRPLHYAASNGHYRIVQLLLRQGAEVNAASFKNHFPLHIAARLGFMDIVKLMVEEYQADVKILNSEKEGLAFCALGSGKFELLEYLLMKKGVDVNVEDSRGYRPLHHAAIFRVDNFCTRILLKYGAVIPMDAERGWTALHCAAYCNAYDMASVLLAYGHNVHGSDECVTQPIHLAVWQGHVKMTQLLCEHGANVKQKDSQRYTPLHVAVHHQNQELFDVLMKNHDDVDVQIIFDITALHLAARFSNLHMVNKLLKRDANVNRPIKGNITSLHLAAIYSHLDVVKCLLSNGAYFDVLFTFGDGIPVWRLADHNPREDVKDYLLLNMNFLRAVSENNGPSAVEYLEQGALVNIRSVKSGTPIIEAVACNNEETVNVLIGAKADLNLANVNGLTALHYAALNGNYKIVLLLLAKEVRYDPVDKMGETPMSLAEKANHEQIAEFLKDVSEYFDQATEGNTQKLSELYLIKISDFDRYEAITMATNGEGRKLSVHAIDCRQFGYARELVNKMKQKDVS